MMSKELGFFGRYILLLIMQLLLCNYFMLSPYILLTLLPVMVLSIPLRYATPQVLLISFVTALAVDFLADGVPGLNVVALLPVALVRKTVIRWVFGTGLFARGDKIRLAGISAVRLDRGKYRQMSLTDYLSGPGMAAEAGQPAEPGRLLFWQVHPQDPDHPCLSLCQEPA